jgi:Na+/phosphate symporter
MAPKDPSTTHHQHNQLVLLGDIANQLERIGDLLERLVERQGVQANALLQLSDEHGSSVAGPF